MSERTTSQRDAQPATGNPTGEGSMALRPGESAGKKRLWVVLGAGLSALVVAGAGLALWLVLRQPAGDWRRDARYLPDDCHFLVTLKAQELLNSKAAEATFKEIARLGQTANATFAEVGAQISGKPAPPPPPLPDPRQQFADGLRKEAGLDLADIQHVTIAGQGGFEAIVVVVRASKPVKAEEILARIQPNKFSKSRVAGHTLYEGIHLSFALPEDRAVIFGSSATLRKVLERNGEATLSPSLKAAVDRADFSKSATVVASWAKLKRSPGFGGGLDLLGAPAVPETGSFSFDVSDGVAATFRGSFKEAGEAEAFKTALERQVAAARKINGIPPALTKVLETIRATQSGNSVTVTASSDAEVVVAMIAQLGTQANRTFTQVGDTIGSTSDGSTFTKKDIAKSVKPAPGDEKRTFKKVGKSPSGNVPKD
jgi:hypothetical protein